MQVRATVGDQRRPFLINWLVILNPEMQGISFTVSIMMMCLLTQ
uniref:Uncharacterized protein n=1 Tax=Brassica campestris TaxID=3711 RepID=A0A3P5ZSP4_BRACM|nr:unnamed protein product [Brassica rapa]